MGKNRKQAAGTAHGTSKPEIAKEQMSSEEAGPPKAPSLRFLVSAGGTIILGLSVIQIILNGIVSLVVGVDFLTATFFTAAIISTGAVVTVAIGVLGCLYCFLVFFAGMYGMASSRLAEKTSDSPSSHTNSETKPNASFSDDPAK